MLLVSHVGDVSDVKYLNKRSKATLYTTLLSLGIVDLSSTYILIYFDITLYTVFMSQNGTDYNIRSHYFSCQGCQKVLYTYMNRRLTMASLLSNLNWVNV